MEVAPIQKPKPKNPYRISLRDLSKEQGFSTTEDFLGSLVDTSVVPACCSEGCEVEPDGRCEHGCPSAFLAAGVI